jgi:hypothetical protein
VKHFLTADHGPTCERIARAVAVAIVATYAAGYAAGRAIHRLNDRLAAAVSGRQLQPQPIRQRQAAATVTAAAIAAPPLSGLTVVQLRKLARAAGHRSLARSGRKADLLATLG